MDGLTAELRRENMRLIRSQGTKPERAVRAALLRLGERFDCNPGVGLPDIVLPGKRGIFVHGCFWHAHDCVNGRRKPVTNTAYWTEKQARNVAHDLETESALLAQGWRLLVVWECETLDFEGMKTRLKSFLEG